MLKKFIGKISIVMVVLLLVACSGETNNLNTDEKVKEKVYTKNNLHQMMVTSSPKTITTECTFTHEDAWSKEKRRTSINACNELRFWHLGKITFGDDGNMSTYDSDSNYEVQYSYDDKGLRTMVYTRNGVASHHYEERIEGQYIAEYYINGESGEEMMIGKNLKDSEGLITKKIDYFEGEGDKFDHEYEYENGHLCKITNLKDGEYISSKEIEYDILPVKVTLFKEYDKVAIFTFDYELDEVGNWIKCNKYYEDLLIMTYERTIVY